jgi:H+/gluconate symporter-like permease
MIDYSLLFSVLIGVSLLILLILKFKFQPFIALLISSILVGVLAGIAPLTVMETVKKVWVPP